MRELDRQSSDSSAPISIVIQDFEQFHVDFKPYESFPQEIQSKSPGRVYVVCCLLFVVCTASKGPTKCQKD